MKFLSPLVQRLSLTTAIAVLSVLGTVSTVKAAVLDFDNLSQVTFGGSKIPNGYNGFNWENFYYIDEDSTSFLVSGYGNGAVSDSTVAFNGFGRPASLTRNTPFNFDSAYLTAALDDRLSITVAGLLDQVEKYSETVKVDTLEPTLFEFNYEGIDQLKFTSFNTDVGFTPESYRSQNQQFVLDNLTYAEPSEQETEQVAQRVPEPPTLTGLLLGSGFLGLMCMRRLKRKSVVSCQ